MSRSAAGTPPTTVEELDARPTRAPTRPGQQSATSHRRLPTFWRPAQGRAADRRDEDCRLGTPVGADR